MGEVPPGDDDHDDDEEDDDDDDNAASPGSLVGRHRTVEPRWSPRRVDSGPHLENPPCRSVLVFVFVFCILYFVFVACYAGSGNWGRPPPS